MKKSVLLVSIGVLIILVVAVLFVYVDPYKKYKPQKPKVDIPTMTKDNVVKIEIYYPENEKDKNVVLSKKGSKWVVKSGNNEFPVDENAIRATVEKLSNFKIAGIRSRKKEKHELFEVDSKHGKKIVVTTDKGKKFTFIMGKTSSDYRTTFIIIPGDDTVYAVKGALKTYFDRDLKAWRNKRLFDFDKNKIKKIQITQNTGKKPEVYTFEMQDDGSWKMKENADFPVNKDRLASLANQIAMLRSQDFIDDPKNLSEYGLDAPQITVKITLDDGKEEVILIGKQNDKKRFYTKIADRDKPIYLLASWQVDRYKKDLSYYEDTSAAPKTDKDEKDKKAEPASKKKSSGKKK